MPETYIDILKKYSKQDTHKWKVIRQITTSEGRGWSPLYNKKSERYTDYICTSCGARAIKRVGESLQLLKHEYEGLTCDEIVVIDILD